ncbi:unnamed protein product [Rotaria sordida]|uniref:Protein translocase subunit SecA n=1 Tax=Rotaria sordida TaxID=392033 RepID=A0A819TP23_9BILA|nr:unnamed protein product [Rotaria sordida]CAF4067880.1 unnamed protein product [Rotaria sordida]
MFQLIDVIKKSCKNEKLISQIIIDLLMNISNNEWILNDDILNIIKTKQVCQWEKLIEDYMKEKRCKERNLQELINLMIEDKKNLNNSIKNYLKSTNILNDLKLLIENRNKPSITKISDKLIKDWNKEDIQNWSSKIKGNKLLSNKEQIQDAIIIVSQAIYLYTYEKSGNLKGFYPRITQIIALWLFLNPDLNQTNMGCLAQISTGEGKSIIVAALAAIKALACHRIDIITSSNVLAIRDSEEFQSFFQMFNLQVSNNCDSLCEQGNENQTAEEIRKLRYYNKNGPVDIIYGECSCFERDILLTEFNKNDENQNIIGKRMTNNSIPSIIIDEVDSMLLDKANMVLYLSHNIDTLKSLERIFISIWQTINQQAFDLIHGNMIDDDLIQLVSDMIFEQIDNKSICIPEYNPNNYDYINIKLFIKRRMNIWIRSAFHVKDMIPNDTYIISRDKSDKSSQSEVKITVMDKDTGTEQLSTRWSNGVHQFLQLKHSRRLTSESLKAVFISNMSFFKRYKNHIIGLTGSLGSIDEQNLLNKIYQVRFFELPRFKQELFRELKGSVNTIQENWLKNIQNALDREIKFKSINKDKRRAVLIICENVKSVLILKEYLSNSYPNAKVYKSAYENFEIDQLNPGDIIIATNLAGRGTDLNTSNKLEENGGLHVITTYLPTNIRIEMQAFGRTARKGNKGTGEYIILNPYGLSIENLKQLRNTLEKERLNLFLINDLPKIKIEEDLLQGFDDNELSCIGFTKLYQNIENKLLNDNEIIYYGNKYIQFQLYSLKNRWAFWLDSMTEHINMINTIGKKKIIEKFNEFKLNIEKDIEADNFKKLIIEPAELIKLGKYYRDSENWSNALLCYKEASNDKFYSFINYYTSSCYQNINYVKGIPSKKELKHSLIDVKLSIENELQFLNTAAQVAFEIGEKNRKLGFANYGNEYDKQVKEKITIWNIFSSTIINIIGSPIDSKDLTTTKYLSDEGKAKELLNKLEVEHLIKPTRITKKPIKQIELPSLFNTNLTKEPLLEYLNNKSQARKNKLDYETFKEDFKQNSIFLPYLNKIIDLIKENGFIEEINNNNIEDQLYLFENFDKKNFPKEILYLQEILIDYSKEISKDRGFTGTKTDLLLAIKEYLSSKKINITDDQLNIFYEFLNKNSYLEKIKQYSVKKDEIIKNKEGNYQYSNLYDFERHYTDNFQNFDFIIRRNFLKIILIEVDNDDNDSYLTLKDIINSNDFEVLKTEDDAMNYLWNYLKSTSFIKTPAVNIGLIDSEEVNKKREKIKEEIKSYLDKVLSNEDKKELDEAVNSVFNIIDQTIGELKKLPNDKTIASYLQIKTNYFLNNNKHVPEALEEFIELALDVVFRLEEKKEPPKWYEIAAVITLGVIQIVAGVLAKFFIPFAGQLIGEFLISTGCDDVLFGIQCAISGEFSWEKYWQHKKQSMISSALTSVIFVGASYLKNAKRLKSLKKAWNFQKLTGAEKLATAASKLNKTANIGKYIGKEVVKTLTQTGLSELASIGINQTLDMISSTYEIQLSETIKKSVNDKWNIIHLEMTEIFRLSQGDDSSKKLITDCINRKLQNLPEATILKTFTSRCGPVMQGLGRALADGKGVKGTIQRIFTSYAPSLINLGVNIGEIIVMIEGFMKNLANDLKDTKKKLTKTDKQYELKDFQDFENDKIDQISKQLSESFNQKLKSAIITPVLNFATNTLISKGIESIAGADRIEQLANRFELIHAATNPNDTKTKYADDLIIFLAEAKPIDIKDLNDDPKDIYPANLNGVTLEQVYGAHGDKIKTFIDRNGNLYVRRPTTKDYYRSVRSDKPAGLHEQKKIDEVLGCVTTKGEIINNEQQCTLKRTDGLEVSFVIKDNKDNLNGIKHAEILIDGRSISINLNNENKNDCYYMVVLVANEMSKGKSFNEAMKIHDNKNAVKNLRYDVSLAMKNDEQLLNEFRWTNRTDFKSHYNSLTGLSMDSNKIFSLNDDDITILRQLIQFRRRPDVFELQELPKGIFTEVDENGNPKLDKQGKPKFISVPLARHHLISVDEIFKELNNYTKDLSDAEFKTRMEIYLNDTNNDWLRKCVEHEMNVTRRNANKDGTILLQSLIWSPNIICYGPKPARRGDDPGSGLDKELLSEHDNNIINIQGVQQNLNIIDKISLIGPQRRGTGTWYINERDPRKKFGYKEDLNRIGHHPYLNYGLNDKRKLDIRDGELKDFP